MKKITFLIACLLAVFGMSAINHYDNFYVIIVVYILLRLSIRSLYVVKALMADVANS